MLGDPAGWRAVPAGLPGAVQREVDGAVEFIRGPLSEEPRRVGAPLRKPFEGQWRARRGEYRIRYAIDEDANISTSST